jgi:hypothetical protein
MGDGDWPAMKRQAEAGVHMGWAHSAVGMQRALESAIGLPSRSTSASRMLVFVTPPGREKKPHACLLNIAITTLSSRVERSGI